MKLVHLVLILLSLPVMSQEAESIVVTVSAKEVKQVSDREIAVSRLDKLMAEAKIIVEKFESVRGRATAQKFETRWKERVEVEGMNEVADRILLCRIKSIKEEKNEGKPIKAEEVYEAALVLLKYERNNIQLPTCFVTAMLDIKIYNCMLDILVDAKKILEPNSTIADAKEKGAAEAAP